MTKKPSEGKAPITGRSGRERVKDRQKTEAGAKVIEKRYQDAIEHRGRNVIGDAVVRYASRHPTLRGLIALASRDTGQEDVLIWLDGLAQGEPPLEHATFLEGWDRWQRLRELDQKIESACAGLDLLLTSAPDAPDEVYQEIFGLIDQLVLEWEEMMGIVHPLGHIMRMTA